MHLVTFVVFFFQHGIGIPSLSVVFNEIIKLVYYAKCQDVEFFRIGTCGGLGNASCSISTCRARIQIFFSGDGVDEGGEAKRSHRRI